MSDGPAGLALFVPGTPVPQGSLIRFRHKTTGKTVVRYSNASRLDAWRSTVRTVASDFANDLGVRSSAGPVSLRLVFRLRRPKSAARDASYVVTRPDLDKLVRAVSDSLASVVYENDSRICQIVAEKRYAEGDDSPTGVLIESRALTGPAKYRLRDSANCFVDGTPVSQGSMDPTFRALKPSSSGLKSWRLSLRHGARRARFEPGVRGTPRVVSASFTLPRPKSRRPGWAATGLDLDKLLRAVGDGMSGVGWHDDSEIVCLLAEKLWSDDSSPPGLALGVRTARG